MKLLDTLNIDGVPSKRIELLQGDLANIPSRFGVDLLVVSAFPNDYLPTPSSLIGALHRKGLIVSSLAKMKDRDLRKDFSCWLSHKISPTAKKLHFERILCFEPLVRGGPPQVVGDIFRALTPILAEKPEITSVAMPIVAAGDQGHSVSSILIPLLEAARHWMKTGLPLNVLRIVAHSDNAAKEAVDTFALAKAKYLDESDEPRIESRGMDYDVFISYAHEDTAEMEILMQNLKRLDPSIRIFLDRKDIDIGSPWQPKIFENLDRCIKIATLFSPDYLKSKVCKEEFNIAWVRSRNEESEIIFPIYVYSADLPTYMTYRKYLDCREGENLKLTEAARQLIELLPNRAAS